MSCNDPGCGCNTEPSCGCGSQGPCGNNGCGTVFMNNAPESAPCDGECWAIDKQNGNLYAAQNGLWTLVSPAPVVDVVSEINGLTVTETSGSQHDQIFTLSGGLSTTTVTGASGSPVTVTDALQDVPGSDKAYVIDIDLPDPCAAECVPFNDATQKLLVCEDGEQKLAEYTAPVIPDVPTLKEEVNATIDATDTCTEVSALAEDGAGNIVKMPMLPGVTLGDGTGITPVQTTSVSMAGSTAASPIGQSGTHVHNVAGLGCDQDNWAIVALNTIARIDNVTNDATNATVTVSIGNAWPQGSGGSVNVDGLATDFSGDATNTTYHTAYLPIVAGQVTVPYSIVSSFTDGAIDIGFGLAQSVVLGTFKSRD